ncbi:transglycosylase family protein [Rhodococcus sp. HNM0569]|uniref:transglycosylase family protein n=1 Tax=Rhodococcus sp. HNM0569 TaxID=2716340 RepID=UPI00146C6F9C|nr:transglycosylase family protein [Rhodococcus sp. HNM0569]NLU82423.1 transglycosylase family protein [Rhodococcus sp. HNM0569]
MTGRHRKPTNTGRNVAKVAVTGAIIGAGSAAFAGTANAAPDSDWDRLAQCESGGNWGINTGNGFQGGLQFSPSTWNAHGGQEYAATANQASREQQIVVAERVLQSQGWGAWPSCSSSLGLSSAPTERETPAAPKAEASPVAEAPSTDVPTNDQGTVDYAKLLDNAIKVVKDQGIDIDPQILDFVDANKALLPQ